MYVEPNKTALALYNFISLGGILIASGLFATQSHWLAVYWIYISVYSWWLAFSYTISLIGKRFRLQDHLCLLAEQIKPKPLETVDVFLPNCGEDIKVLNNTFAHVARLKWPRELLTVYCLDDKNRKEVKVLAERYNFKYLSRPNRGHMAKAGNLKFGFENSSGDYILVLDADFAVSSDFIQNTICYMRQNPKLAIVQTPQFFETRDPRLTRLARGAGYVQELFYRLVQTVRDTWGGAVCCGTSALYRRKALESVGGYYQIQHSEDVNTGFQMLTKGWQIKYIPLILSKGLCPDQLSAYFSQQYRWATGSLSLCFSKRFWIGRVPLMVKLNYLSGMLYYICTSIAILVTPLHTFVMAWWFPFNVHWYNPMFIVPAFAFGFLVGPAWHKGQWGLYALRLPVIYSYAHLFAIRDLLTGNLMPWQATGSVTKTQRFQRFRQVLLWYNIIVAIGTFTGIALSVITYPLYHFSSIAVLAAFWLWLTVGTLIDDG